MYSVSLLSKLQEPHPQPPPRKRRGGYDVSQLLEKSTLPSTEATVYTQVLAQCIYPPSESIPSLIA